MELPCLFDAAGIPVGRVLLCADQQRLFKQLSRLRARRRDRSRRRSREAVRTACAVLIFRYLENNNITGIDPNAFVELIELTRLYATVARR